MFRRRAAARILPALLTVLFFAGVSNAQTAPDAQKQAYAPEPAPYSASDADSLVNFRFVFGQDLWVQPHIFICAGAMSQRTWEGDTETHTYWSKEAYLKNGRVSLDAQITRYFSAFYQTDDISVVSERRGRFIQTYGKKSNAAYVKDAYLHFIPATQLQLYAGLLTVPLNRSSMTSDTSLLGIDKTAACPEFGSHSRSGRDTGAMVRGLLFHSIFEYRFGVFQGMTKETNIDSTGKSITRNPTNLPRYSGRIQINGLDPEEGYFYSENYLSKREVFGIGFGMDYQPNIYHSGRDYIAWAIDMPMNVKMQSLYMFCAQANVCYMQNYPDFAGKDYSGLFYVNLQAGFLVAEQFEPLFKYTFGSTNGDSKQYKTLTAGFNYYIDGNKMNIKSGIDMPVGKNKHYKDAWKAALQFQLYM